MGMVRSVVVDAQGLGRPMLRGDGFSTHAVKTQQSTDSAQTLAATAIQGGIYERLGMTAGRTDTTDTAVAILALNPNMDIGDSFLFKISVGVAFALTLTAGTGVTLGAKTSVAASSAADVLVTKTAAATVTMTIL